MSVRDISLPRAESVEVNMFLIRERTRLEVCRLVLHCIGHIHATMELLTANQLGVQATARKIGRAESVPLRISDSWEDKQLVVWSSYLA